MFGKSRVILLMLLLSALLLLNPLAHEAAASTAPDPNDYTINRIPWNFIDITATGTELQPALTDEGGVAGVPIGFDFQFYGTAFNTLTIISNGYITFGTDISADNTPLPSTQLPDGLIAPFWDDLNPELNPASAVYYKTTGAAPERRFIVQWKDYPLSTDPGSRLTFEIILFEGSGEIQFHYLGMTDGSGGSGTGPASGGTATTGIESPGGGKGSEVAFNREGTVTGGTAYSFTPGGNAFQTGRPPGDLNADSTINILDQSILTDTITEPQPLSSSDLLLSDTAPQPGTGGRAFGDGVIDALDHAQLFQIIMGRAVPNPVLSDISYYIAPAGETLTLYGSGFDCTAGNNTIYFTDTDGSETAVTAETVNTACTELTITVPAGLQHIISIRTEHNGLSSNPVTFIIQNQPLITNLAPDAGRQGDTILIRGHEFGLAPTDNRVDFNGTPAIVNSVNTTNTTKELNVTVPAGATTGPVTVTVAGNTSNAVTFTTDGPPVVSIDTPAPNSEIRGPVDITGTAYDLRLTNYTLAYSPAGADNYTTFAAGTSPVTNGVLGNFNPTGLPDGPYTIKLTATDADGQTASTQADYNVFLKIRNFTITGPADGDTINRPDVTVTGTVTNTSGNETGVTVNGITAVIYNGQFTANHIPLQQGQNTITANATDTEGYTASVTITVTAETAAPHITLTANIESGTAPLTAYFSVSASIPDAAATYEMDYEGDGATDYTGTAFENISFTYTTEGVYYPAVTVTDTRGTAYTDTIAIVVLNTAALDALLQSKWSAMKAALANQDIEGAVKDITGNSKDTYREQFTALLSVLDVIGTELGQIQLVKITDNRAEYEIIVTRNATTYSFHLLFVKESNGLWKIERF